jgi:hypothetical protein
VGRRWNLNVWQLLKDVVSPALYGDFEPSQYMTIVFHCQEYIFLGYYEDTAL